MVHRVCNDKATAGSLTQGPSEIPLFEHFLSSYLVPTISAILFSQPTKLFSDHIIVSFDLQFQHNSLRHLHIRWSWMADWWKLARKEWIPANFGTWSISWINVLVFICLHCVCMDVSFQHDHKNNFTFFSNLFLFDFLSPLDFQRGWWSAALRLRVGACLNPSLPSTI